MNSSLLEEQTFVTCRSDAKSDVYLWWGRDTMRVGHMSYVSNRSRDFKRNWSLSIQYKVSFWIENYNNWKLNRNAMKKLCPQHHIGDYSGTYNTVRCVLCLRTQKLFKTKSNHIIKLIKQKGGDQELSSNCRRALENQYKNQTVFQYWLKKDHRPRLPPQHGESPAAAREITLLDSARILSRANARKPEQGGWNNNNNLKYRLVYRWSDWEAGVAFSEAHSQSTVKSEKGGERIWKK